jgi:hypothetical protein
VHLPGIVETRTSKAHLSKKAVGVTWWSAFEVDTTSHDTANAWLVTKRISDVGDNAVFSFWAAGGSPTLTDSLQIWVSTIDSTPSGFTHYIGTINFPSGSWGNFQEYAYDLFQFNGQAKLWIGFRYYMNVSVNGVFIHFDDFYLDNPFGVQPLGNKVPSKYELKQNYPNPFNPFTNIEFDLPNNDFVSLTVYNSLGQEIKTVLRQDLRAGSYRVDFNASNLPSGTYFYRLTAGDFVKTMKMVLVK